MSDQTENKPLLPPPAPRPRRIATAVLAATLLVGAGAGAAAMRAIDRASPKPVLMLQPGPVGDLKDGSVAAVRGRAADIFGNSFVLEDGTGRTLVDTGRRGEGRTVVAPGEQVTAQGRFENGKLRAQVVVHADGRSEAFDPPPPPRPDRDGPPPPRTQRPDREARQPFTSAPSPLRSDADAPPPPPPPGRDAPPPAGRPAP